MMKEYDSIAITERVKKLKTTVVEAVPEICIERAKIVTEAYQKYEAYPVIVKRALSLKMVLEKMNIYVEKGELIVGNQAYRTRCAPIFPEYSWDWILDEIDEFEKRRTDRFVITEKSKQELSFTKIRSTTTVSNFRTAGTTSRKFRILIFRKMSGS